MTKKSDGELNPIPNEKYEKFFAKFAEVETLEVPQWKVAHLLGYFCKKWKEAYDTEYHWKFNNQNPNKCFEVWQMNTLVAKLSANPQILKDYIDWVFVNVVPKKSKLRSISFMTNDELVIPYKMNVLLGGKKNLNVDRSTPLPEQFKQIINDTLKISINTYGDFAFVSQMRTNEPATSDYHVLWTQMVGELAEAGFDMDILKRIV